MASAFKNVHIMKADKISVPSPYSTCFYSHFKVVKSLVLPVPNFPYAPCRRVLSNKEQPNTIGKKNCKNLNLSNTYTVRKSFLQFQKFVFIHEMINIVFVVNVFNNSKFCQDSYSVQFIKFQQPYKATATFYQDMADFGK